MPLPSFQPSKHLYLFHHVGKCGGTSIVHALGQLGSRGISLGFPAHTRHEVRRYARQELVKRRISPRHVRAFYGHRVYFGLHHLCPTEARYFTFLRAPQDRVVSLYNFHCDAATDPAHVIHERHAQGMMVDGRLLPFEVWLREYYVGNQMVRFLAYAMRGSLVHEPGEMSREHLSRAKEFLDRCWFIGFTETSEQDLPRVCGAIGVRSPRRRMNQSTAHLSREAARHFASLIEVREQLDMELFEYASQLRGSA